MNAEFQSITRRNKKAVLSDQCKEIEENIRMGKTRDLFKKSGNTKRTFHAKMGSIKDRNGMDLTESEDIKKMWQDSDISSHCQDVSNTCTVRQITVTLKNLELFFSRLVPFFYTDINDKTSWVSPICFLFLFSVYLLCISQPLRQDPLGHSDLSFKRTASKHVYYLG